MTYSVNLAYESVNGYMQEKCASLTHIATEKGNVSLAFRPLVARRNGAADDVTQTTGDTDARQRRFVTVKCT